MKKLTIAVLTDWNQTFVDLKNSDSNVDFIRIRSVEEVRGRFFDGYCIMGNISTVKDAYEVIEAIKSRQQPRPPGPDKEGLTIKTH